LGGSSKVRGTTILNIDHPGHAMQQQHNVRMLACSHAGLYDIENISKSHRTSEHYIQREHATLPYFEALVHPGVDVSWL
jgi:hypothetical protein